MSDRKLDGLETDQKDDRFGCLRVRNLGDRSSRVHHLLPTHSLTAFAAREQEVAVRPLTPFASQIRRKLGFVTERYTRYGISYGLVRCSCKVRRVI